MQVIGGAGRLRQPWRRARVLSQAGYPVATTRRRRVDTTTVNVLRHGQVENPDRVLYGRLPGYHLSALGVRMAEAAAEYLRDVPLTHLRCSPLERAR